MPCSRFERYLAALGLLAYVAFALPHMIFHVGPLHDEVGWSIVLAVTVR